jgi:hypothetical protein
VRAAMDVVVEVLGREADVLCGTSGEAAIKSE